MFTNVTLWKVCSASVFFCSVVCPTPVVAVQYVPFIPFAPFVPLFQKNPGIAGCEHPSALGLVLDAPASPGVTG